MIASENFKAVLNGNMIHLDNEDVQKGRGTIVCMLCSAPDPTIAPESYKEWENRAKMIVSLWNTHVYRRPKFNGTFKISPL